LLEFTPHDYQKMAIDHILEKPKSGIFLDMGLGKTVITLTALDELIYNRFEINKVLIIAPLRVAETTWSAEVEKWAHTRHLRLSKILGPRKQRVQGLWKDADIYLVNRENVVWLVDELDSALGQGWDFDMVVIDELSSFKSPKAQRFTKLRKVIARSKRVVGLTGTPAPNGLIDLWSQMYLLDQGERLGKTITGYRERYFAPNQRNAQVVFNYKLKEGSENSINNKISDICMSMKAEDWLDMPERLEVKQSVKLSQKEQEAYDEFERTCYMDFVDGEVSAVTAAALTNKLLQYTNGAMYKADGDYVETSTKKLDALEEIIELANGKPVLVFYSYRFDKERIRLRLKKSKLKIAEIKNTEDIENWNSGKVDILLAHPASAGHGLNLQAGGNIIVWFGLTWSLELYQQANARLWRQGQKETVIIHHLITQGTADEAVMRSLLSKHDVQEELLEALKAKVNKGGGVGRC